MTQFDSFKTAESLVARIEESMHSIGKAVFRTRDVDEKNVNGPMAWS